MFVKGFFDLPTEKQGKNSLSFIDFPKTTFLLI